ncbi:ferrous iron transport protein B [Paramaledivibacter caminithermalis]|jgi:ferrous iron transport protein B|uniref:Ferrous iron transport protein B n=1 Tax=Paramaledivibacter caminithermalis (strain DSM 15212 / CIP 107654 / DViRD3) TaxID=1121301 RepID=A0A1M6PLV7_PARC5|nr:ferrous iron transport protein B [Paramaledivibacter caminithermalis]SHK08922.1 ferrous iron transport protein B [Paramaledivibacter caminithermalis DSM 15212]
MSKSITIALAGNPNSGKTTLFNALTGAKHSVGNWPGVTVEKKEGKFIHNSNEIIAVDLPGTYSLSPYSLEEMIARNYIVNESPEVVINIVDASNIERNLYLSMQLIELGKPVVIALNMMDIAERRGHKIDHNKLSQALGVPVVPIVATQKKGLKELLDAAVDIVRGKIKYNPNRVDYGKEIEDKIQKTKAMIKDKSNIAKYDLRWLAIKVIEEDEAVLDLLNMKDKFSAENEVAVTNEDAFENDFEAIIADRRYSYITSILSKVVKKPDSKVLTTSDKIDRVITNRWLGLPIFAALMYLVFWFTFNIGNIFLDMIDGWFGALGESAGTALEGIGVAGWLNSLIVDGIIGGVGGVLVFLPNIVFLFIAMSLLEDSGYMARVAFIMDRAMRKIGLSGKAFIPMLMGFGCTVPAIMGTRTLEDEKDRLATMLVAPFMSCGARLPIYVLFAGVFFPGKEGIVVWSLYIIGIIVAVIAALIFKKTIFKGEATPFVMELPPYRIPTLKVTGSLVWEKAKGYLLRAGTIIFAASIVIWFILNFNFSGMSEMPDSIGAGLGKVISPIFKPLGFGSWEAALSLITGLLAKEVVVSSMAVIYGLGEAASEAAMEGDVTGFVEALNAVGFTSLSAYAFMVFSLLYTPCIAVIGTFKKESNSWKWTGFSVAYQFVVAWVISMLVFQVGTLIGF